MLFACLDQLQPQTEFSDMRSYYMQTNTDKHRSVLLPSSRDSRVLPQMALETLLSRE